MSKELLEKKNDLITRSEEIVDTAKKEERDLTQDEVSELSNIRDSVKNIVEQLRVLDELRELKQEEPVEEEKVEEKKIELNQEQEETRAFEGYIRSAVTGEYNERANNLDLGSNGAIIPTTIANKIIKKVYDISPVLAKSTKYNVKGKLAIPYYDEATTKITVAFADEFTELASNVGQFKSIELSGYLAGALSKVSRSLINDSNFNLTDFIVNQMAESIALFIENALLNGVTGKVKGLSSLTNSVTAGAATAVTADDMVKLQAAVKDVYQRNAIWVMSPATRTALRLLKDQNGRYMLEQDLSSPFGFTLLGKPVYVSDAMPDMATKGVAVYYGDFSGLATKFDENINIQVLREHFATQHAVGVVGWLEFDGAVEDAQKLAVLKMA